MSLSSRPPKENLSSRAETRDPEPAPREERGSRPGPPRDSSLNWGSSAPPSPLLRFFVLSKKRREETARPACACRAAAGGAGLAAPTRPPALRSRRPAGRPAYAPAPPSCSDGRRSDRDRSGCSAGAVPQNDRNPIGIAGSRIIADAISGMTRLRKTTKICRPVLYFIPVVPDLIRDPEAKNRDRWIPDNR